MGGVNVFQMTVNDVFEILNVYTVYGKCSGIQNLKPGTVKDETGREYAFSIPVGKDLVIDENAIELQLLGQDIDLQSLLGKTLVQ